uniref:Uncharacterized protein n=1 Tax=Anguilla anguilla TaxID=7936 RepID=A0A0E9SWA8_ANGAN
MDLFILQSPVLHCGIWMMNVIAVNCLNAH